MAANASRFMVSGVLGWIVMFISKAYIVINTVSLGFVMIWGIPYLDEVVTSLIVPCIVIAIIAFLVATFFLSVFSFGLDTIIQCFLIDESFVEAGRSGNHRPPELEEFANKSGVLKICCC